MSLKPVSFLKGREHAPRLSKPYVPGKHSERFWTEAELEIVRRHYPDGGSAGCAPHLPKRSTQQIYATARRLGVRFEGMARHVKREWTEDLDEVLRREWPTLSGRGAVNALAERMGQPRWLVSKNATRLGLTSPHKKEPPWTAAEEALLRKLKLSERDINAASITFREHGFSRSPSSIRIRAIRMGISRRDRSTFSATTVAKILGMDAKTVSSWLIAGDIPATRRGTARLPQQGGDQWAVEPADLRRFVIDQIARIDIRKVDKFAFVDLLTGDAS